VIDLSRTAAKELGFVSRGLTRVKVEEVPEGTEE
jgi:rare lipoprotein A (peptidoglycan hydrolase)